MRNKKVKSDKKNIPNNAEALLIKKGVEYEKVKLSNGRTVFVIDEVKNVLNEV